MNDGRKEHDGSESGQSATLKSYESEMIIMSLVQIDSQKLTDIAGAIRNKVGLGNEQLSTKQMKIYSGYLHQAAVKALENKETLTFDDIAYGYLRDDVCPEIIPDGMFQGIDLSDPTSTDFEHGYVIPEKVQRIESTAFGNTGSPVFFIPYGCTVVATQFGGISPTLFVVYSDRTGVSEGTTPGPGKCGEQEAFSPLDYFSNMLGILWGYSEYDPETGEPVPGTAVFIPDFDSYKNLYFGVYGDVSAMQGDLFLPDEMMWAGNDELGEGYSGTVTEIPDSAFEGHYFRRIKIGSGITSVGNKAFQGNTNVRIYVPSTVLTAGTDSTLANAPFKGCEVYTDALEAPVEWNLLGTTGVHYGTSLAEFEAIRKGW